MKIALLAVIAIVGFFGIIYVMGDDGEATKYYNEFTESDIRNFELELFEITNEKRIENGVSQLVWDEELHLIARSHSQDMAENNFFAHVNLDRLDPEQRGINANYDCFKETDQIEYEGISENIAQMGLTYQDYELDDAQEIIDGLMNSPGHKKLMLNSVRDKIGIGIAINENHLYSTQNFC